MTQTIRGKSFEFACLNSIYLNLGENSHGVEVVQDESFNLARNAFLGLNESLRQTMSLAANTATRLIMQLEPQILNPLGNNPLILQIQPDSIGQAGDVRDVLIMRRQNNWEIGISCKHNHYAAKHNRLSYTIDFGLDWFGLPCTEDYFNEIEPIFTELRELRESGVLWGEVENKHQRFYVTLLQAFINELNRLYENHGEVVPQRFLAYLLGRNDFYKVIANDRSRTTEIQAYCINGTLNAPAGDIRPTFRVNRVVLPSKFYNIDFRENSTTTINIVCDHGWAISARIHSAESLVNTSLKFDIQLVGLPQAIFRHHEGWSVT